MVRGRERRGRCGLGLLLVVTIIFQLSSDVKLVQIREDLSFSTLCNTVIFGF